MLGTATAQAPNQPARDRISVVDHSVENHKRLSNAQQRLHGIAKAIRRQPEDDEKNAAPPGPTALMCSLTDYHDSQTQAINAIEYLLCRLEHDLGVSTEIRG